MTLHGDAFLTVRENREAITCGGGRFPPEPTLAGPGQRERDGHAA